MSKGIVSIAVGAVAGAFIWTGSPYLAFWITVFGLLLIWGS